MFFLQYPTEHCKILTRLPHSLNILTVDNVYGIDCFTFPNGSQRSEAILISNTMTMIQLSPTKIDHSIELSPCAYTHKHSWNRCERFL